MNHTRNWHGKKRILSLLLMLSLILGSFSYLTVPANASNAVSKNELLSNSLSMNQPSSTDEAFSDEAVLDEFSSEKTSHTSSITSENKPLTEEETADETTSDSDSSDETLPQAAATTGTYTLIFDYNGGTDAEGNKSYTVTANKGDLINTYMQAAEDKNPQSPYRFLHKWDMYVTETGEIFEKNGNTGYDQSVKNKKVVQGNYTFKAKWSEEYADFNIAYMLDGGAFDETNIVVPYNYTYVTETITLPSPMKKGYIFGGFYTDAAFNGAPVTTIPKGSIGDITLYTKWISAAPATAPSLTKATNSSKGKVTLTFPKMENISGYELLMSTSKNFKKNANVMEVKASASSVNVTNLPKGKTYYFKLRAYTMDSTGEKCYSTYSNVQKRKITKGVKESKATATSAKLKTCRLKDVSTLSVSFKVSKRLKSSDDSYYLVTVDPVTKKFSKKLAQAAKTKNVTFELPLRDNNGNDYIHGNFALAVKNGKKYTIVSKAEFISNPEAAADYTDAFPESHSKKGIQGSYDADLGLSHIFLNMHINKVLNGTIPYKYNGKTYYFNDPWGHLISAYNEAGLTVTGQLMLYKYENSTKFMILKSGRVPGKNYYAINAQEKKARETFEAATNFLAERYSTKTCHLDNWILGNEVNIHQTWYYAGNISKEKFMENYADTFRILYYSVKSHSANSRVYICTDHTWVNRHGDWGAKPFMDAFNKEIKSQQKNIQWNLAYHAYPSILTSAATWNDKYAPNNNNADFVSPKNLNILTSYVQKNFGSKTRIILSEQGFTSSSGQDVQAAAIAYTYYKAEFDPMIDAVIFRSDIDNDGEAAQGLYFGLKDEKGKKKPAYDVFKYMDTTNAEKYTNKYLKTIGISKWKDIAPKYDLSRFK